MKRTPAAASPDAYVTALAGWLRQRVEELRAAVRGAAPFEEVVKWGHLVYFAGGPVLLIRAEERRVLFGFWRGQRLRAIEPRLVPGGKYEMATMQFAADTELAPATARKLAREAFALDAGLGDPRLAAKRTPQRRPAKKATAKKKAAKKQPSARKKAPRKTAPAARSRSRAR